METRENDQTRYTDRDMLFAFAHGIRMTLESLGLPFDGDVMQPILQRMDAILGNAKHSLIKGDDSVTDWKEFRHLRKIEQQLCSDYLNEVNKKIALEELDKAYGTEESKEQDEDGTTTS